MTVPAPRPAHWPDGPNVPPADLAATDAWYERVAARTSFGDDPLAATLVDQLNRIDEELLQPAPVATPPRPTRVGTPPLRPTPTRPTPTRPTRSRRMSGRVLAPVLAAILLSLAGAGIAAADTGSPLYPLHLVLFGDAQPNQPELDRASALLDQAAIVVARGQERHALTSGELSSVRRLLAESAGVLDALPDAPRRTELISRQQTLSQAVERLAGIEPPEPTQSSGSGTADPSTSTDGEESQPGQRGDGRPTQQPDEASQNGPTAGPSQTA